MGSFFSSDSTPEKSSSSSEHSGIQTFHSSPRWQLHFNSVKDSSQLMVIDFSASWCGPCKFMEPVLNAMAAKFTDDVAQEFGVQGMPTFVLLKKGKEVDRVVGAQKNDLEKKIEKHRALVAAA
ncbi:Thioredoxin H2 -like protein [Gossypium arboreum]|uniref:Thioredoxin H2-like protein n=1 Tax=Gossypium arboreum TaxID=29729 RepID=A0A0B0NF03_GOSAR|nr:Thioredoxin H2 -like protein [Gossypium arboreum]